MNNVARILLRLMIGVLILLSSVTIVFLLAYGLVWLTQLWPFSAKIGQALITVLFILILLIASYAVGRDIVK